MYLVGYSLIYIISWLLLRGWLFWQWRDKEEQYTATYRTTSIIFVLVSITYYIVFQRYCTFRSFLKKKKKRGVFLTVYTNPETLLHKEHNYIILLERIAVGAQYNIEKFSKGKKEKTRQ